MKKGAAVSSDKVNPLFEKLEQLTNIQRIAIWAGLLILAIVAFIYFAYMPKLERIDNLHTNLKKVQRELEIAKNNARQLNTYRKKMQAAEKQFKIVMRALPESEEIPTLLTGISKAGKDSGLNFVLFKPKHEDKKDFYAEIPVDMKVIGDYHGIAMFFESVADLNRIVNIRHINITPDKKGSSNLLASCTAVTYKFLETPKKKTHRKKKR
jgi:type IV pilus assembly protein PilO